jgi:hypothetical protein
MAMPITTGSFAKALWPGVEAWYGKEYNEYPVEFIHLFEERSSHKNFEEIIGITSFGLAQVKPEGGTIAYDTERQGFLTRATHVVFGLGFIITREMYEDDQYDVVGERKSKGLAFSMRQTQEVNGANVYNRAFNSAFAYGDGQQAISAAHPNVAGGTWSNALSVNSDLSEASLEQACNQIALFTNDRGLIIAAIPESLIIPWALEFEAVRILKSAGRVGTDFNDLNALKELGKFRKGLVINHFLTDLDAWYIRTNVPDGMLYFNRRAAEFGTENDFDTENAKFKATQRYSFTVGDPRAIFGSPGA